MKYARSIARTSDGGFIVAGESNLGGSYAIFLHKLDAVGFQTGLMFYDFIPKLYARIVKQTLDGGYIVVGYHVYMSSPSTDVIVIKTDSTGVLERWKQYDGGTNRIDYVSDVVILPDGGYIVIGQGAATINDWDIWLFRLDTNGDTLWNKFIGEQRLSENAYQIRALSDGGYIIAGAKEVAGCRSAAYLVRVGPEPVGIKDNKNINLPQEFACYHNYPNPFNASTEIEFRIPRQDFVTLRVYNILGEEIATLLSASLLSDSHKVQWDASGHASGVYLYRLQAGRLFGNKEDGVDVVSIETMELTTILGGNH